MDYFWMVWVLLTIPFYIWLTRFWFKHSPDAPPWIVFPLSLLFCVPVCVGLLFTGIVFRALNWATDNG